MAESVAVSTKGWIPAGGLNLVAPERWIVRQRLILDATSGLPRPRGRCRRCAGVRETNATYF